MGSNSSKEEIKAKFEELDVDKNGTLSKMEIKKLFENFGDEQASFMLQNFFEKYDKNGDDRIDYKEFLDFMSS